MVLCLNNSDALLHSYRKESEYISPGFFILWREKVSTDASEVLKEIVSTERRVHQSVVDEELVQVETLLKRQKLNDHGSKNGDEKCGLEEGPAR